MPFTLSEVVPWGRSFDEYVGMFALSGADLRLTILGVGDGPASFNAGATARGAQVVSVDPIYRYGANEIRARIDAVFPTMLAETERNRDEFVWRHVHSVRELGSLRRAAMEDFLGDYELGQMQQRYRCAELPALDLSSASFDLALCSHFLFLYSQHHSLEFHLASINELCRVAAEVRIFPLNELGARPSRHLHAVIDKLRERGYDVAIETTDYEFQKGANQLMRVRAPQSSR